MSRARNSPWFFLLVRLWGSLVSRMFFFFFYIAEKWKKKIVTVGENEPDHSTLGGPKGPRKACVICRMTETGTHSNVINMSEMTWGGLRTRVRCIQLDDRNMGDLTSADLLELNEIAWQGFFFVVVFWVAGESWLSARFISIWSETHLWKCKMTVSSIQMVLELVL